MSSICDRIADDEKQADAKRIRELLQASCKHRVGSDAQHFTYGIRWVCPDCGKHCESWWD